VTEALHPSLILCTTCRNGGTPLQGEEPPGAMLYAALRARLSGEGATLIELRAAACLANCDRGCSAAIAMPGKWTYLLGFLRPALADDLLAYAKSYAESGTGIVLPSRRPASLRNMIIGRIPDLVFCPQSLLHLATNGEDGQATGNKEQPPRVQPYSDAPDFGTGAPERDDRRRDQRSSESRERPMTESGMGEREGSHSALEPRL
jgi:predicted metal-binding protein